MKGILFLVAVCFMSAQHALACGRWILKDVSSSDSISMRAKSTVLSDPKKADPTLFRDSGGGVFPMVNGNKIRFRKNKIWHQVRRRPKAQGGFRYTDEPVGTYSNDAIVINGQGRYKIDKVTQKQGLVDLVIYLDGKRVAEAVLRDSCQSNIAQQIRRVQAYFVWKNLKINPHRVPVENWWWQ